MASLSSAVRVLLFISTISVIIYSSQADDDNAAEDAYYSPPKPVGNVHFAESFFTHGALKERWVQSKAKKDGVEDEIAKYDGEWELDTAEENSLRGDIGLVLKSKARHAAISAKLDKPFVFGEKPFIAQYEVKFQNGMECGGAYIKLLTGEDDLNLEGFNDKTPYTIMFGPDKCGNDAKVHFIFRHKNPRNGTIEEKHSKKVVVDVSSHFNDKKTHLYTLVVNTDNTYQVLVDDASVNRGSLLEDFTPPVNPPEEVDDPNERKPGDWDDREKIADPESKKPEDWDEDAPAEIVDEDAVKPSDWLDDEETLIPDPDAAKPEDWDDEMDGEWEPPLIQNPDCESVSGCGEWKRPMKSNPDYKGKWYADMIDNPDYKGEWKPRRIKNPDWFHDPEPFKMTAIGAIGLELWSMTDKILFDNFIVTDDKFVADRFAANGWALKQTRETVAIDGEGFFTRMFNYTNERPWLWAVYLIAVILPIVLIITYCCSSSSGTKDKKKTDDYTADDDNDDEDLPDDEVVGDDDEKPKKGKGALEEPARGKKEKVIEEEDEEEDDEEEDEDDEEGEDDEEDGGGDKADSQQNQRSSPRRRKPRRD